MGDVVDLAEARKRREERKAREAERAPVITPSGTTLGEPMSLGNVKFSPPIWWPGHNGNGSAGNPF